MVSEALPAITGRVTIQKAKQDQGTSGVWIARSANAGTGQFRVFTVEAGGHLTLDQVRVSNGDVDGDGGGIHNAGTLILQNGSVVTGNTASGSGGGIYNSGTLQMTGGCLVGNTAPTSSAVHSTVPVTISGVWWGRASGPGDGAVNDRVMATNPLQTAPTGCGTSPSPTLTPIPTATPTPTATPSIDPYYDQYMGIMFWAIYNESNENRHQTLQAVMPNAPISIPNTLTTHDHRYVMARIMLSNIPRDNTQAGVGFMQQRWAGSIGNTDYRLWKATRGSLCQWDGRAIGTYKDAVKVNTDEVLRWFNGYAHCFRTGQRLGGVRPDFDVTYSQITGHITNALQHHLAGATHPAPGALFVKHTSSCFVWHRHDVTHQITSCRGKDGKINMETFCGATPIGREDGRTRNCRSAGTQLNPANINVGAWLMSAEGRDSNQQLGLETTVGTSYSINLGFYTPDQPFQVNGVPTSGQGCENNCYFLLGNPHEENSNRTGVIPGESVAAAWQRHQARFNHPGYGYTPNGTTYYIHVLFAERYAKTWITYAFQAN